jgi:hypothetical protein
MMIGGQVLSVVNFPMMNIFRNEDPARRGDASSMDA